jgi:hypothetical protein
MKLNISFYHEFFKPKFRNIDFGATIPREIILENHSNLFRVIQRFLSCAGRFTSVYQYHITLLMHFIGRKPLELPYYLFISLRNMDEIIQVSKDQGEPSLFHFLLINVLVLEELIKRNLDWKVFFMIIPNSC